MESRKKKSKNFNLLVVFTTFYNLQQKRHKSNAMSSAGHVFDMIARMKNNRIKHDERRIRQKKVMESLSAKGHTYDHLNHRDNDEPANVKVIGQIHQHMLAKNRKSMLIQFSVMVVIALIVAFAAIKLIF